MLAYAVNIDIIARIKGKAYSAIGGKSMKVALELNKGKMK